MDGTASHINLNGRLHVVGGSPPAGGFADWLQEYDPQTSVWHMLVAVPQGAGVL